MSQGGLITGEQIDEVRSLASAKLSDMRERCTKAEFGALLLNAMRQIATDFGLDLWPDVITVRDLEDLDRLETVGMIAPVHLIVESNFDRMRPWLDKLAAEHTLASICVYERGEAVDSFASGNNDVPVFVVAEADEVVNIAVEMRRSPHSVISKALNGDNLGLEYLGGSPS